MTPITERKGAERVGLVLFKHIRFPHWYKPILPGGCQGDDPYGYYFFDYRICEMPAVERWEEYTVGRWVLSICLTRHEMERMASLFLLFNELTTLPEVCHHISSFWCLAHTQQCLIRTYEMSSISGRFLNGTQMIA